MHDMLCQIRRCCRWIPSGNCWGVVGQVYYGEWKGQEVAVKVMSAEASHQNVVLQEVRQRMKLHLTHAMPKQQDSPQQSLEYASHRLLLCSSSGRLSP